MSERDSSAIYKIALIIPAFAGAFVIFALFTLIPNLLRTSHLEASALIGNLLIIPASWFYVRFLNRRINYIELREFFPNPIKCLRSIGLAVIIACSVFFLSVMLVKIALNARLIPNDDVTGKSAVALILTSLIVAFYEELFFRGFLFVTLYKATHRPWLSLLVSSILFAGLHNLSINGQLFILNFIHVLIGSMVIGLLFFYFGNLWGPIVLHALFNILNNLDIFRIQEFRFGGQFLITFLGTGIQIVIFSVIMIYLFSKFTNHGTRITNHVIRAT